MCSHEGLHFTREEQCHTWTNLTEHVWRVFWCSYQISNRHINSNTYCICLHLMTHSVTVWRVGETHPLGNEGRTSTYVNMKMWLWCLFILKGTVPLILYTAEFIFLPHTSVLSPFDCVACASQKKEQMSASTIYKLWLPHHFAEYENEMKKWNKSKPLNAEPADKFWVWYSLLLQM